MGRGKNYVRNGKPLASQRFNIRKEHKTRLRKASEHNVPSFRANNKGKKWLDPGKESLTDEMTDFIYSLAGTLNANVVR